MKRIVSILLLITFTVPNLYKGWIYVDFKVNQDRIAKTLCIEKDNPTSTCDGKCFFSKQLKKANEKEKKQNSLILKTKIDFYVSQVNPETVHNFHFWKRSVKKSIYHNLFSSKGYLNQTFHPPTIS